MKVGIYNEPSGTFGGSEYVVAVMADALARDHQVDIVHHNSGLTRDQLTELSGLDLRGIALRYVEREARPDPRLPPGLRNVQRRYQAELAWHASLSRPYDVFINSTHNVPPFCHARRGVLLTLFPAYDRRRTWPWTWGAAPPESALRQRAQRGCSRWLWQRRFASYRHKLSISEYTRRWTRTWWGIDTDVVYPPVDTGFDATCKSNLVLSVGRFATYSHSKRQLELMSAFHDMKGSSLGDWCYYSAGGLTDGAADRAYFDEVSRVAATCGGRVVPNIPRPELRALFGKAKLFWHAAGFGADHDANPFQAEHFGISTVEAMAAGAVPIVYDQGGQSEIVEHGRSGYLWRTLNELGEYTRRLAHDDGLREEMAAAARLRAARFSRQTFVNVLTRLVQ